MPPSWACRRGSSAKRTQRRKFWLYRPFVAIGVAFHMGRGYDLFPRRIEEAIMSQVYNPEAEQMQEIERLELEARDIRRRIEHARGAEDRRVMNRLLADLEQQVRFLQSRLPH